MCVDDDEKTFLINCTKIKIKNKNKSFKIVLKIKSIVMRTTNNLFRKVHNYIHFMG